MIECQRVVVGHVGLGGEPIAEILDLRDEVVQLRERLLEHVADAVARVERRILGKVGKLVGPLDSSGVRRVDAGEDAEQGRLAGPVLADDADPLARMGRHVHAVEDGSGAECAGQVEADQRRGAGVGVESGRRSRGHAITGPGGRGRTRRARTRGVDALAGRVGQTLLR